MQNEAFDHDCSFLPVRTPRPRPLQILAFWNLQGLYRPQSRWSRFELWLDYLELEAVLVDARMKDAEYWESSGRLAVRRPSFDELLHG